MVITQGYFKGYTRLKRAFKPQKEQPYTKLQFIIERAPAEFVPEYFPLGVRTFYRSYPTPDAIEIVHKDNIGGLSEEQKKKNPLNRMPYRVICTTRPTKEDNNGSVAGNDRPIIILSYISSHTAHKHSLIIFSQLTRHVRVNESAG